MNRISGSNWRCFLLFFTLVLLGIDSAFSMVEGVSTVLYDNKMFRKVPRWIVTLGICVIGMVDWLMYCADVGL